jgi:hypothetical protein
MTQNQILKLSIYTAGTLLALTSSPGLLLIQGNFYRLNILLFSITTIFCNYILHQKKTIEDTIVHSDLTTTKTHVQLNFFNYSFSIDSIVDNLLSSDKVEDAYDAYMPKYNIILAALSLGSSILSFSILPYRFAVSCACAVLVEYYFFLYHNAKLLDIDLTVKNQDLLKTTCLPYLTKGQCDNLITYFGIDLNFKII